MDVVYLYYGVAATRVPFYGDQNIFNVLAVRGGGVLDRTFNEIIFNRIINVEKLRRFLPGIPFVQVEENLPNQPKISGFFERPWKIEEAASPFSIVPSPPEILSEYWLGKLEAELCARKYSPKTQRAYIYYNRLICRILQKTPEEIQSDDITQFLATVEKDKNYSSSSINLAISSIKFFYGVIFNSRITEQHRPRQNYRLPVVMSKDYLH
jgi:hypothetical protein